NPERMIGSDDGGAFVSYNGGKSWSTLYNQMTAQFYHIATDNRYPYHVYGTQQDNSSLAVPSRTHTGAIGWNNCYAAGTGESGFIAPHPKDHNIVYLGAIGSSPGGGAALQKYDHRTGQIQLINVWPDSGSGAGKDDKYRFQWTFPIVFNPHNSDVIYACGNHVFKTENGGHSWDVISPDLTVADPETLEMSGGPITFDTAGAEMYATIFAFAASPHEQGVLWTGSDDGLIHVTKDEGKTWTDVTPHGMKKFTQVTSIEHSSHDAGTVYVSAAAHKEGDYAPYLYKTSDYGATWTLIVNGLPEDDFFRVIREDPNKKGLLYAGSELGVFFSLDDGANWQSLQNNLPVTPVYDLLVKENDLVVGTHGRSFWILDDVTPLHQMADLVASNSNFVVAPRDTIRIPKPFFADLFDNHVGKSYHISLGQNATFVAKKDDMGHISKNILDAGTDVAYGVVINYYLEEKPEGEVKIEILDSDGNLVRGYSSIRPKKKEDQIDISVKKEAGMNTLVWNMNYGFGPRVNGQEMYGAVPGPLAPPGDYQVRLSLVPKEGSEESEWSNTQAFKLVKDPRVAMNDAQFADQFAAMKAVFDKHSAAHAAVNKIRSASTQIDGWLERMKDHAEIANLKEMGESVKKQLSGVEDELIQKHHKSFGDVLNHPSKLIERIGGLPAVIGGSDNVPTQQSLEVKTELSGLIDEQLGNLDEIVSTGLSAFSNKLKELQTPAVYLG
ncbi:MAG: WD40/YVTN/BNR-like repeat-containing protein, partial [Anaerolineae bacterium]